MFYGQATLCREPQSQRAALRTAGHELEAVAVEDLPDGAAPFAHDLLILPMQTDEIMLGRKRAWLEGIWAGGAAILANDIVVQPYLHFLRPFEPMPLPGVPEFQVRRQTAHPAFDGLPFERFHLRGGMAGVYGVGHNPPPEGAVVVNTIGHGAYAIDWYLRGPNGALFFCHGGNDLSAFHSGVEDEPNLTHGLIGWMLERAA